ncbi:hypothetical protein [Nocardia sp. NPDC004722]
MRTTPLLRHTLWGAATLAMAASVSTLSVPTASADIESESGGVLDCSTSPCTTPSTYIVGHTYDFSTGAPGGTPSWHSMYSSANFYDNGQCIGSVALTANTMGADVQWVPTTAGTHNLTLKYNDIILFVTTPPRVFTVTVVAAPPGSPAPKPSPSQGTCTSSGSGTGSGDSLSGSAQLLNTGKSGS